MLTPEQIDGLILAGSYHNAAGGIYATSVYDFANDVQMLAAAAARAEVEPLVRQMQSALQNLLAAVRGECPGLLDEDRGGSAYLGMDADDVIAAAGAWLSPQDKENNYG